MTKPKQPYKYVRQEFERMGARPLASDRKGCTYEFPDRTRYYVFTDITQTSASALVRDKRHVFAVTSASPSAPRPSRPKIELDKVRATDHAKARLKLMDKQAGISTQELVYVLRCPVQVCYSPMHQSWIWYGDRIALAIAMGDGGVAHIKTVLWANDELWAENPRPRPMAHA